MIKTIILAGITIGLSIYLAAAAVFAQTATPTVSPTARPTVTVSPVPTGMMPLAAPATGRGSDR